MKSRGNIKLIVMKKFIVVAAMLVATVSPFNSRAQNTIDGGTLPEAGIICKVSYYTVNLDFGYISFTYRVSVIECDNGFRQAVDNFWSI